jgi:hypothetical protein
MGTLIVLALIGAGLWAAFGESRRKAQSWDDALAPYGSRIEDSVEDIARIAVAEDSLEIKVEAVKDGPDLVTVVIPEPRAFLGVEIRKASIRLPWGHEPETGDPELESIFRVTGSDRLVSSLLDAETRRLMIGLSSEDPEFAGESVRRGMSIEQVPTFLPDMVKIAKRLARPPDVAQCLAENAQKDPVAGVRLRNLVLLLEELPGDPKTVAVLRAVCSDTSPQIRLRAARELGAEGGGVLAELAGSLQDDGASAEAISYLGRDLPLQRTREILAQALHHRHSQTARACLDALGQGGDAADVELLVSVMTGPEVDLAAAAAQALGTIASPAAEPPLILALQREQEVIQVAAADALGRLGSAAAVLPLQEAAKSSHGSALRKATREAIAAIQSRLQGASPGQLSLAGAGIGNLSLAQAEGGELSLAGDADGQLSLSGEEEENT